MGKRVKKRKSATSARQSRWETRQLAAERRPGTSSQLTQKLFLFSMHVCVCMCVQHSHPAQESQSTAMDGIQLRTRESHTHQTNCQASDKSQRGAFHHAINQDRREMVIAWCQGVHLNPSGSIVSSRMVKLIYVCLYKMCFYVSLHVSVVSGLHRTFYKVHKNKNSDNIETNLV